MEYIGDYGPITLEKLCRDKALGIKKKNAGYHIKRLEKYGFLKTISSDNHRIKPRILTPLGQEILNPLKNESIRAENTTTNVALNDNERMNQNQISKVLSFNNKIVKNGKTFENGRLEELLLEQREKSTASEKYFRTIVDSSLDGITVVNEDGKFEFGNDSFFGIMGWPKEEIIGQYFIKMIPEDARELGYWKNIQKYHGGPHEIKVQTKSGEIRYLNISSSQVEINGENKALVILHDISKNKRQEIELRESEEKYRDLFENAQDPMYVLDVEGNFLKMNKIGLQMLGCTKEEFIGTNISKWITPESLKIVNEYLKKSLSGETLNKTDTLEIVCKNGEHRWVEIKTRGIRESGKKIEIHGIGRDITENRLLKQELRRSNKQQKLLVHLIQGTRGGKTRALILKHLSDKSYNANQLATALNMDYKTIRHHLYVLIKNGIITKSSDGLSDLYFISKTIESDFAEMDTEHNQNKEK